MRDLRTIGPKGNIDVIRLMLLDDHAVVRQGYRRLLECEPDLDVRVEVGDAAAAYAALASHEVDIAVVDLNLGRNTSGLEAIRRMKARQPTLRVLVFSMHVSAMHVVQALRAGAQGYVSKASDPAEVTTGLRRIADGERVLSTDVACALADDSLDGASLLTRLTPREFEVLRLSVHGDPVSRVAERLHLSPKTVFNHLSIIRSKLGVSNDLQLLHLAVRHGLVDLAGQHAMTA